jgi:hypothetical protein
MMAIPPDWNNYQLVYVVMLVCARIGPRAALRVLYQPALFSMFLTCWRTVPARAAPLNGLCSGIPGA